MELQKAIDDAGQEMMEVSDGCVVIARIYPHPEGIRIVSEYLDGVEHEAVTPPALVVKFTRGVVLESETPEEDLEGERE